MSTSTMRLLSCPACGGPLDPPSDQSSMRCLYCGHAVIIPESLRAARRETFAPQTSIFSNIDMNAMVGYGTQWAEVVRLAQMGSRQEAIQKYMQLTGNDEESARYMVDNLGNYRSYAFDPGSYSSIHEVYAPVMNQSAESIKAATRLSLWLGCAISAFVFFIIIVSILPVLLGLLAGLMSMFR